MNRISQFEDDRANRACVGTGVVPGGIPESSSPVRVHVRWAIRRDMPQILAMEAQARQPWTEEQILSRLRQRNCIGMAATVGEQVVGHMIYSLEDGWIEVLRLLVDPRWRRRKVGSQMVAYLLAKLQRPGHRAGRRKRVELSVSEHDLPLQLLLRKMRFRAEWIERSYRQEEDHYRMIRRF